MNPLKSRFELVSHAFTEASNVVSSLSVLGVGSEMEIEILSLVRNYLEGVLDCGPILWARVRELALLRPSKALADLNRKPAAIIQLV